MLHIPIHLNAPSKLSLVCHALMSKIQLVKFVMCHDRCSCRKHLSTVASHYMPNMFPFFPLQVIPLHWCTGGISFISLRQLFISSTHSPAWHWPRLILVRQRMKQGRSEKLKDLITSVFTTVTCLNETCSLFLAAHYWSRLRECLSYDLRQGLSTNSGSRLATVGPPYLDWSIFRLIIQFPQFPAILKLLCSHRFYCVLSNYTRRVESNQMDIQCMSVAFSILNDIKVGSNVVF